MTRVTISLPDDLFASADELAERIGLSRGELYARAVADYVARHRDLDVTARLNAVYTEEEDGAIDPALRKAQARSVRSGG